MKHIKTVVVVVLALLLAIFMYMKPSAAAGFIPNLLRAKGEIKLPLGTMTLVEKDNGDFVAVGVYQVPEKDLADFAAKYAWEPAQAQDFTRMSGLMVLLDEKDQPKAANLDDYRFIEGCKKPHHWQLLLNQRTRRLWVEVTNPELTEDGVGCTNDSTNVAKPQAPATELTK